MDDNTHHHHLVRLTFLSFGLATGVAVWRGRWRVSQGLRLIGLWSYLAAVNGARPDMKTVLEADRASDGTEMVRPYWGYADPLVAAQRLQPEPAAAINGRSTGRTTLRHATRT